MSVRYVLMLTACLAGVLAQLSVALINDDQHAWKSNQNTASEFGEQPVTYQDRHVNAAIQPLPVLTIADPRWVQVGKALFSSPLLSVDNSVSCASCHDVFNGGDDGFSVSTGVQDQLGERNSPTVLNAVFNFRQFWDGRSADLQAQAIGPIHNPVEMGSNWNQIIEKLNAVPSFKRAFNELSAEGVTAENILKAIVAFESSLVTENAPIDLFLLGDESALTERQKRGYSKFVDYGCVTCHQGKNIGGNLYQKIGRLDRVPETLLNDSGRYKLTNDPQDMYVFKVPSLRNVALTSPYFHNGSVDSLSEAIRIMAKGQLGLSLNDSDVADIEALLNAFTGEKPRSLR